MAARAAGRHKAVVLALLAAKPEVDSVNYDAYTLLPIAVGDRHAEDSGDSTSTDRGTQPIDWTGDDGYSPLFLAVLKGQEAVLIVLLVAGANLSVTLANGQTPLLMALDRIHEGLVLLLIEAGADVY